MRGGAFLKGKEGRVGFRKKLLLTKDFANERNEGLLSNCRVQLILFKEERGDSITHTFQSPHKYQRYEKGNCHTPCSIRYIPHDYRSNRTTHYRHEE